jgi:hypothetical protein
MTESEFTTSSGSGNMNSALMQMLKDGQEELNEKLAARMAAGAKEYGELAFLDRDTIEEVMEEIADVINWSTFVYLKMYMVRAAYNALQQSAPFDEHGFVTTQDLFGKPRS